MFNEQNLTAAVDRARDTVRRADELGIGAVVLAQVEAAGGVADDAKRLYQAALDSGVPVAVLAIHASLIEAGGGAPPA